MKKSTIRKLLKEHNAAVTGRYQASDNDGFLTFLTNTRHRVKDADGKKWWNCEIPSCETISGNPYILEWRGKS